MLRQRFGQVVLAHNGKGMVASLHCVKPDTTDPDSDLAWKIVGACVKRGLMMFAPVGFAGSSVKLAPPLVIGQEAMLEWLYVLEEVF